jgi:hypothetical protein
MTNFHTRHNINTKTFLCKRCLQKILDTEETRIFHKDKCTKYNTDIHARKLRIKYNKKQNDKRRHIIWIE